jgi:hypothetical protein
MIKRGRERRNRRKRRERRGEGERQRDKEEKKGGRKRSSEVSASQISNKRCNHGVCV